MIIWHGTEDTPAPNQPRAGHELEIKIGTFPVAPGQSVQVRYRISRTEGGPTESETTRHAMWFENRETKSYWLVRIGPFKGVRRFV